MYGFYFEVISYLEQIQHVLSLKAPYFTNYKIFISQLGLPWSSLAKLIIEKKPSINLQKNTIFSHVFTAFNKKMKILALASC